MATPLQVLFIEDSTEKVNLILGELRRGGFAPSFAVAGTWPAVESALAEDWEIVIIGDPLAGIDPVAAVTRLGGHGLSCFVVAKEVHPEKAAALKQAGARDIMSLDDLAGLVPAIEREILAAAERTARRVTERRPPEGKSLLAGIDVTGGKQAEEALVAEKELEYELARERDLLHTLMDSIPDSIYFKDEACRYTRVNAATARILGLADPREAIGKTVFDFLSEENARSTYEDEQRIIQTGQPLINKIERLSRGGTRWVLTTRVPTRDRDGNVTGIVGISRDITERKRAEEELTQSFDRLRRSMEGAIQAMALAVEIRDPYTAGHQRRVAQLAHAIAKEMGLSGGQVDGIRLAAAIHDVGKIYIPAEILSKPGRITENEFSMIRTHPQVGHDILKIIEFPWPISLIVLQHHKRMDGSGYPPTLPQEEILLEARILSVADVVEAMSSHRPYRPALGIEKALREISMNSGLLYDPRVVAICLRLFTDKDFSFE